MKKLILYMMLITPFSLMAQIGIKGGLNFAKVSKASDINSSSRSGFHAGIFLAPPSKKIISSRTEILFSRQGYDYKNSTITGNVNHGLYPDGAVDVYKYYQIFFPDAWRSNILPDQRPGR